MCPLSAAASWKRHFEARQTRSDNNNILLTLFCQISQIKNKMQKSEVSAKGFVAATEITTPLVFVHPIPPSQMSQIKTNIAQKNTHCLST